MAWVQEIYDTLFDPNTVCVACISHGKDSLAMLRAIKLLGLPLHRIVTSDVWATQDIPADLPPMWEWKKEADQIIKELYGIDVEHICAMQNPCSQIGQVEREREREGARECYESMFYRPVSGGRWRGNIKGFPCVKGSWCKKIKYEKIDIRGYILSTVQGRKEGRKEGRGIYGFATHHNVYCRGELKNVRIPNPAKHVVQILPQNHRTDFQYPSIEGNGARSSNSFLHAPRMRGERQISSSISE